MYWTFELIQYLSEAPWPATKGELIEYAKRTGAPSEVVENLEMLENDEDLYHGIDEVWPDCPSKSDFFNEEQY